MDRKRTGSWQAFANESGLVCEASVASEMTQTLQTVISFLAHFDTNSMVIPRVVTADGVGFVVQLWRNH